MSLLPESDRQSLLDEAEDHGSLPTGEELAPEVQALLDARGRPFTELLLELYWEARDGTASDVPVPSERFRDGIERAGLDAAEILPQLRRCDRAFLAALAQHHEAQAEESRRRAGRRG